MELKKCASKYCTLYALPEKNYCRFCLNLNRDKEIITEKCNYKFKSQIELFKHCWNTRPHKCFVTEQKLDRFEGGPLFLSIFAHILRKSAFFEWRLNPDNIVLLSPDFRKYSVHRIFDEGVMSEVKKFERLSKKSFRELFELERKRREQYENLYGVKNGSRKILTSYGNC